SFVVLSLLRLFSVVILCRPPSSTLFPYTTLFRSARSPQGPALLRGAQDHHAADRRGRALRSERHSGRAGGETASHPTHGAARIRSEEHTSELQSRENLVCRLLLEKKKKTE